MCARPTGQTNCNNACVTTYNDRANRDVRPGLPGLGAVRRGVCACPAGSTNFMDACVDTASDVANCGACWMRCAAGLFCVRACTMAPPAVRAGVGAPAVDFVAACGMPGGDDARGGRRRRLPRTNLGFPFRYWATELAAGDGQRVVQRLHQPRRIRHVEPLPAAPPPPRANATVAAYWGDNVNRGNQCVVTLGPPPTWRQVFPLERPVPLLHRRPGRAPDIRVILNESGPIDVLYQTMTGAARADRRPREPDGHRRRARLPRRHRLLLPPTSGLRVRYNPVPREPRGLRPSAPHESP